GHPETLKRAFLNIIINAHQALMEVNDRPRELRIVTGAGPGVVRVAFYDNGPGVAEENLDHVFDPFFTTKPQGHGMGLGLSVAYGVVRDHDGAIWMESTPGEGAAVIIELPA